MASEVTIKLRDLERENKRLRREMELAWGLIANAHGGDWNKAPKDWREAAEKWRDRYLDKK